MKHALRTVVLAVLSLAFCNGLIAQAKPSPVVSALLTRARTQEQTGHIDLAAQTWQQVLLIDARDGEALTGLARWAKLAGRDKEATEYLARLRQVDPGSSQIATIENTQSSKVQSAELQHAAELARQGHSEDALRLYRSVWGKRPPDGDWALAYYDTEAATEAGRPDAVESLRALAKRYPADQRYSITLGRILTYSPQTRPEGVRLLAQFPQDAAAQQAMRQAEAWSSQSHSPEAEAQQKIQHQHDVEDAAKTSQFWATVQRGTTALDADHIDDAVAAYKAALQLRPNTVEALQGLSGAYMKGSQPAQAIPVYRNLIKLQPKSTEAYRGLFNAQVQANQQAAALDTDHRLPADVKSALQRDPQYLRSLAAAYAATGHAAEAEATLDRALKLPASNDAKGVRTDTQLQYAGLLADAKQFAQAARLYREILYDDPENLAAWQGMISMQHQTGHDAEAIATVERMSPATYDAALEDNDFPVLLAGIYQQQSRFDLASDLLQRAARNCQSHGRPVPLALQLQLASVRLQQNHTEQAYAMFRAILGEQPDNIAAWKGLITALHQTHRDRDALAQLRQLPASIRRELDRDVEYDQAVAGIYAATDNSAAALQLIAQIQQHYRSLHIAAPADVDIQNVWLLYNTHDDRDLYRALMALGDRDDLSDTQRHAVQNLWATWSVRRAGEAVDAGDSRRSLSILNVASQAFPGNADVAKALAGGYLKAGEPKHAMAIYSSLDLTNATAGDYQSMVGAALAAPNLHQAEVWLREALQKFANDPQVLAMAARFELARGDHARAAGYWKASLAASPAMDPANRLAHTLDRPDAGARRVQGGNLSSLLDPDNDVAARSSRLALPSYRNTPATQNEASNDASALYGPDPSLLGTAPVPLNHATQPTELAPPSAQRSSDRATQSELLLPLQQFDAQQSMEADAFAPPNLLAPRSESAAITAAPQPESPHVEARAEVVEPNRSVHLLADSQTDWHQPEVTVLEQHRPASLPMSFYVPQVTDVSRFMDLPVSGQMNSAAFSSSPSTYEPQISQPSQQTGLTDNQLQQQSLPPLRGAWTTQQAVRESDPHTDAEQQLANIEAGYSPWKGSGGYVTHRSGTPGFDQLYILEAPFETSTTIGTNMRLTAIVTPSFLASGTATGTSTTFQLGTLDETALPGEQNASGIGGEGQLTTSNFSIGAGTTPRGFLVANITGHLELHPASRPVKFTFAREAVKDSQLSYSGLNDPGTASSTFAGNPWGGVVSNAANLQYGRGDNASGYYVGVGGQYLTGLNVLTNKRMDGVAGAYWKIAKVPNVAEVTVGANFFGMHYDHNLRFFTYGQGGYFSPSVYFLASVPFTVKGQYGENLHYSISGALGLQAFQEAASPYYPLYVATATRNVALPNAPTANRTHDTPLPTIPTAYSNSVYPAQAVVGGNYDLHAEFAEHVMDRWYIGGFVSLNNTRNYATQTVGFFLRYMARAQRQDADAPTDGPTGIFPTSGFRPLMVP
jgi:Tfp pilus assembly protein PilF